MGACVFDNLGPLNHKADFSMFSPLRLKHRHHSSKTLKPVDSDLAADVWCPPPPLLPPPFSFMFFSTLLPPYQNLKGKVKKADNKKPAKRTKAKKQVAALSQLWSISLTFLATEEIRKRRGYTSMLLRTHRELCQPSGPSTHC